MILGLSLLPSQRLVRLFTVWKVTSDWISCFNQHHVYTIPPPTEVYFSLRKKTMCHRIGRMTCDTALREIGALASIHQRIFFVRIMPLALYSIPKLTLSRSVLVREVSVL